MNENKLAAALAMRAQGRPMHAIAGALGVSRATLYRHLGSETGCGVLSNAI
jgi:AcrR family transcriptional regulator